MDEKELVDFDDKQNQFRAGDWCHPFSARCWYALAYMAYSLARSVDSLSQNVVPLGTARVNATRARQASLDNLCRAIILARSFDNSKLTTADGRIEPALAMYSAIQGNPFNATGNLGLNVIEYMTFSEAFTLVKGLLEDVGNRARARVMIIYNRLHWFEMNSILGLPPVAPQALHDFMLDGFGYLYALKSTYLEVMVLTREHIKGVARAAPAVRLPGFLVEAACNIFRHTDQETLLSAEPWPWPKNSTLMLEIFDPINNVVVPVAAGQQKTTAFIIQNLNNLHNARIPAQQLQQSNLLRNTTTSDIYKMWEVRFVNTIWRPGGLDLEANETFVGG